MSRKIQCVNENYPPACCLEHVLPNICLVTKHRREQRWCSSFWLKGMWSFQALCDEVIAAKTPQKTSILRTLSNTDNGHKVSALGRKFKFFIMDTPGQGVENLWYMYHFLLAVTQTLTLYQSAIPIREQCFRRSILFCSKIRMYWTCSFWKLQ